MGGMLKENPEGLEPSPSFVIQFCDVGPDTLISLSCFPTCKVGTMKLFLFFTPVVAICIK